MTDLETMPASPGGDFAGAPRHFMITGGAGFLGINLVRHLRARGRELRIGGRTGDLRRAGVGDLRDHRTEGDDQLHVEALYHLDDLVDEGAPP